MPRYAVLIHTPVDGAWAHSADPTEMRAAHDRHAEQMTSSGAMVAALVQGGAVEVRRVEDSWFLG